MRVTYLLSLTAFVVTACSSVERASVPALRETAAVSAIGDAADDPAIWVAPDVAASRIVATQKQGGLYVFDLMGRIVQEIPGGRPNNVDLRDGFAWGDGAATIVGASDRSDNAIVLWRLDPATGAVDPAPRARIATGFTEIYGFCLGRRGGDIIAVATDKAGEVGVWRIVPDGATAASGTRISRFDLGSIAEGCVVDDRLDAFYVAQEETGIWRIDGADPTGDQRRLVDRVGEGRLVADVEGLTLYAEGDTGYLIASVQGDNRYAVYERGGANAYLGSFEIAASADGAADAVAGTDGIDVVSAPLGADLPQGLFVAQDDENTAPDALQNFKLVSWAEIATALKLGGRR